MESTPESMRPEPSAITFMARHFVGLACVYQSLNRDGSVYHQGTTFFSGFAVELLGRWYWAGAGHCLQGIDRRVERGELRIVSGSYVDYLGIEAKHIHGYPYTYAPGDGLYLHRPEAGIDFALIPLDGLAQANLQANGVMPVGRQNWVDQHRLDFAFYRMLGLPECRVVDAGSEKTGELGIGLALVAVEQMSDDDDHPGMFVARIHAEADIETIEGMSGGPIYGFRFDEQGNLRYHIIAVQSSWLPKQRVIFACPFAVFAERTHQFLLDYGHPNDRAGDG